MNKENASKLWKIIQEAGDYLQGQLPDHPNHPKGRNPYAHIAICVKDKFQMSYKDIDDGKFIKLSEARIYNPWAFKTGAFNRFTYNKNNKIVPKKSPNT